MITVSNSQNTTTGISLLSPNHFMYYNRNTVSKPKQFVFFVFKKKKEGEEDEKELFLLPPVVSLLFVGFFFFFFLREILFYFLLLLRIIIYVNSKGLKSCTPVSCSFWM